VKSLMQQYPQQHFPRAVLIDFNELLIPMAQPSGVPLVGRKLAEAYSVGFAAEGMFHSWSQKVTILRAKGDNRENAEDAF